MKIKESRFFPKTFLRTAPALRFVVQGFLLRIIFTDDDVLLFDKFLEAEEA